MFISCPFSHTQNVETSTVRVSQKRLTAERLSPAAARTPSSRASATRMAPVSSTAHQHVTRRVEVRSTPVHIPPPLHLIADRKSHPQIRICEGNGHTKVGILLRASAWTERCVAMHMVPSRVHGYPADRKEGQSASSGMVRAKTTMRASHAVSGGHAELRGQGDNR